MSSNNGNDLKTGSQGTVQDILHIPPDEKITISRSKLDHLMDIANDDRVQESTPISSVTSTISQGVFFTSLGAYFNFDLLHQTAKYFCIAGLSAGFFIAIFSWYNNHQTQKINREFRKKLATKISEIINQMNNGDAL